VTPNGTRPSRSGPASRSAASCGSLFRQPVVVYSADGPTLSQAHQRTQAREMPMAIYTMDMFATGNDDDNRAVVRAVPADELQFAGLALHGPRNAVDKIFKGATLHP
jgi:hypothetical protein